MKKSLLGIVLSLAVLVSAIGMMLVMPASAAEINMLDGTYSIGVEGNGNGSMANENGVVTFVNNGFTEGQVEGQQAELGVNCGEGISLVTTPNIVLSIESDVAFNIVFNDANNGKWFNLAANFYPSFGNGSTDSAIAAGTYTDISCDLSSTYTWNDADQAHTLPLPENAAVMGMYIIPQAAGTMTITKMAFVGEETEETTTTTEESTTTTEESTTTTEETTTTTTEPVVDAFATVTIETVKAEAVAAGDTVEIDVALSAVENLSGFDIRLVYNDADLTFVEAVEGSVAAAVDIKGANANVVGSAYASPEHELRLTGLAAMNPPTDVADGDVVYTLKFTANTDLPEGTVIDAYYAACTTTDPDDVSNSAQYDLAWVAGGVVIEEEVTTTTEPTTTTTVADDTTTTTVADDTTTTTAPSTESPATGDNTSAIVFAVVALIAAGAVVLAVASKKVAAR